MRLRLLVASLIDKALHALNMKTMSNVIAEQDQRREALIGDDITIHEQTMAARAFAEEISGRL